MGKLNVQKAFFNFIKNPIILTSIFCAIYIYSNQESIQSKRVFSSGLNRSTIEVLQGTIVSNPVKQKNQYKVTFAPSTVWNKKGYSSSCKGTLTAFIPANFVEQWYPGKLFTDSKTAEKLKSDMKAPVENGCTATLYGTFSKKNDFFAVAVKTAPFKNSLPGKIHSLRAKCRLHFKRLMFAWGEAGGLLLALISGSREYTNDELAESFKNAGLSHIMALSGMHLSLFSGIAGFLGKKTKNRKLSMLLRFSFITLFVWFAGFSPSLFRAFLCSMLTLAASFSTAEQPKPLRILACAYLIHICLRPLDSFSPAFILSYGALSGIFVAGEFIQPVLSRNLPSEISCNLASSIGAQFFTSPYTISVFKVFVPSCTFATLIISPFVTVFMYLGIACIFTALLIPFLTQPFSAIIGAVYGIIKILVVFFSKLPAVHL